MKKKILKNIAVVAIAILTTFSTTSCKKDGTSSTSKRTCVCTNGASQTIVNTNTAAADGECQTFQNYQTAVLGDTGTTCTIK